MQLKKLINFYDIFKNLSKNNFLKSFFLLLFILSISKIVDNAINKDTWEYGEWLINYQNGFNRRGLIGELIFFISSLLGKNIQLSFIILLSIIVLVFYYLNYIFLKKIKINFFYYFIFFSPLFYFFFLIENGIGIRKEIFLYVFYLYYLIKIENENNFSKMIKIIYFFPILLFIHEGIIFYIPYILVPLVIKYSFKNLIQYKYDLFIFFLICFFITLFIFFNKGTYQDTLVICESLKNFAPEKCNAWGPIYALWHDLLKDQNQNSMLYFYLQADVLSWIGYFFYVFYSFILVICILIFLEIKKNKTKKNFTLVKLLFLICFIFSLPLYNVAEDWSRWFSIHFHLIVYSLMFFFIKNKIRLNKMRIIKMINNFYEKRVALGLICLIVYLTLVSHEEYFAEYVRIKSPLITIFKNLIF